MTSFNRLGTVWAGGDYNLLTNILRGEWGMSGFALTDFSNSNKYMDVIQGVMAGGDGWDCNDANVWTAKLKEHANDAEVATAMREATKHILYTVANSNAMNGISANMQVIEVRAWWQNAILGIQIGLAAITMLCGIKLFLCIKKGKQNITE